MSLGKRLLAAALLTTVVETGLSHAMAQTAPAPANPGAMRADARHYVRIASSEHGKNRIGSTYRNLGSDGDPWILSPTKHGRIIGRLRHVLPGEPVVGQLQTTPTPGPQWRQPRNMNCFDQFALERCKSYGHAHM